MPPIQIILNASSGGGAHNDLEDELTERFRAHGLEIEISTADGGEELSELASQAATGDCDVVVAGGGDGTISTVAGKLVGTGKTLGILPLGTLNHFAKDLAIPLDIENAVSVIANGRTVAVDAAEVNGHIFINNSGLGLYPEVVRGRESEQRLGYGKWESLFRSAIRVFRRYRLMAVRLETDGETIGTKVPFVFVGNNEYELSSFQVGTRKYLDRGQLCIYTSRRTGRLALLRLAVRALLGRISQEKDFIAVCSESVVIETPRPTVTVALDGEIRPMQTPLHYRIRPRALRVIVPSDADDKTRE